MSPSVTTQAAPTQTLPSAQRLPVSPKQIVPARPQITVRAIYPNSGSAIDILFNAVAGADHYTLRRGATANGPFTTFTGPPQVSFSLNNYVVNPPCCEVEDLQAYLVGVGQTVYYVVDAWAGSSLLMSTAPLRMDLPTQTQLNLSGLQSGTRYRVHFGIGDLERHGDLPRRADLLHRALKERGEHRVLARAAPVHPPSR